MTLKRTLLASLMAGCLAGSTAFAQPPAPGSPEWERFRNTDDQGRYDQRNEERPAFDDRYEGQRYSQDRRYEQDRYRQERYDEPVRRYESRTSTSQQTSGELAPYLAGKLVLMNKQCIALSRIAVDKAQSSQVKQFAQMTVEEHENLMRDLDRLVGPEFQEHLTIVDREETRGRTSYFRGEPGTQVERAEAERMRGGVQIEEQRSVEQSVERSELETSEETEIQSETEQTQENQPSQENPQTPADPQPREDQQQDQSPEQPQANDSSQQDQSQQNASQQENASPEAPPAEPPATPSLNTSQPEEEQQETAEAVEDKAADEKEKETPADTNAPADAAAQKKQDAASAPAPPAQDQAEEAQTEQEQPAQNRPAQAQDQQAPQAERQMEDARGGAFEYQDIEDTERFEDREYSQEEFGAEIERERFRNYSEDASHSVRRPYSREAGPRDDARWEGEGRHEARWSQHETRGPGSALVSRLMKVECDAAKQQMAMSKQMLQKHSGQDFDMAYLGLTIASHNHLIAQLDAMEQVDSPELQELVREAKAMAEDHLAYARHLAKQLEDQESGDTEQD